MPFNIFSVSGQALLRKRAREQGVVQSAHGGGAEPFAPPPLGLADRRRSEDGGVRRAPGNWPAGPGQASGAGLPAGGKPPARSGILVLDRVRKLITQDEYFPDLRCFYIQLNILNSGLGKNFYVDCSVRLPGSSSSSFPQ